MKYLLTFMAEKANKTKKQNYGTIIRINDTTHKLLLALQEDYNKKHPYRPLKKAGVVTWLADEKAARLGIKLR